MKLIRRSLEKRRSVFFEYDRYIKIWDSPADGWIANHVRLLEEHVPGYVIDHGKNWISYNIVAGTPASEFPHSLEFVKKIYAFCLDQIRNTKPWYHGDWSLSNIMINGNTMTMVDWDNLGQYPDDEVYNKLNNDLKSAFGDLYIF
jgi:RIO-like serine/threonine protein kinase